MAAVLALMAVVGVIGFGVTVLVIRRFKVRQLSKTPIRGAKVGVSGRDLVSFGLLIGGFWACASVGVVLVAYANVLPYIVVGVLFFVLVLLRPLIQAKGRSVFVIRSVETIDH